MKNNKYIIFAILIIVIGASLLAVEAKRNSDWKIGVILPLTGPIASLGESAKNSVLLAEKEVGVPVIVEDDHFDPQATLSSYRKLVSVDKVNAVICFASSQCNIIAPLAEKDKIVLFAIASDPSVNLNRKYVFRLEISPRMEAERIIEYINTKKYSSISSIVAIHSGVQAAYKELVKDERINNLISNTIYTNVGEKDYRSMVLSMIHNNPKAIVVGLLPGDAGMFIKQARELGYGGDFIGFNFVEGEETIRLGGLSAEGLVYSQADTPTNWFKEKYISIYKQSPNAGSAQVYDAYKILSATPNTEDIIKYASTLDKYPGAVGLYGSIEGHEFSLPVVLKTVHKGDFEVYK